MHATYGFLVNYDPNLSPDELRDDAVGTFLNDYVDSLCDENNWWREQALVLHTGQVIPLVEGEDWRGRQDLQADFIRRPPSQRWEAARKFCLTAAAIDLGVKGAMMLAVGPCPGREKIAALAQSMTSDEMAKYIQAEASTITAKTLEETAQSVLAGCEPLTARKAEYALGSWHAIHACRMLPFSYAISDPYTWRFYDLRYGSDMPSGILFVDIHT